MILGTAGFTAALLSLYRMEQNGQHPGARAHRGDRRHGRRRHARDRSTGNVPATRAHAITGKMTQQLDFLLQRMVR
jgi:hypothetical protein